MTTWTSQLTAQPGNYAPLLQTLTPGDGECLQAIYDQLSAHATATNQTLLDYVLQGVCVAIEQDGMIINLPSIATLKAVGVITTPDNIHLGLSVVGYEFMQAMMG
ncbi:MAG: hypothetical protein RLZZ490_1469 [Cyanobacteriota bacterium]|jgi:hypothetical protein